MKHTDNCGRSGRKDVIVPNCKMDCACECHLEKLPHGEKVVDGIMIKYLCQPCLECKAKLEAAEEMAEALSYLADQSHWDKELDGYKLVRPGGSRQEGTFLFSRHLNPWVFAKDVLAAWEKARGEG